MNDHRGGTGIYSPTKYETETMINDINKALQDFSTVAHLDKVISKALQKAVDDFVAVQDHLNQLNIVTNFVYKCYEKDGLTWSIKWHRVPGGVGKLHIRENEEYYQIPLNNPETKKPRVKKFYGLSDEQTIKMHQYLPAFINNFKQYLVVEKG